MNEQDRAARIHQGRRRPGLTVGSVVRGGAARAQGGGEAWPNRPVRFIVPLAPGGGIDFVARAIGDVISRPLGQQVVVENRTGAGGTIGMDTAMKSPPDGYTVLITNDNAASAPHIMKLRYDYTKELMPVIYLTRQPQILAAHPSLGVNSVAELITLREGQSGARLRDLGRRHQPAHHRRMVQAGDRAQARPRALPRRRPGDQRSHRRPCEDRVPRTDRARPALQGRQTCGCSRSRRPSARRPCPKCRRSRRRATRAWSSKPGMRRSCRWARRPRSSHA